MDKKRLKNLKALIKEADELQDEYIDMICVPKKEVADTVNDYSTGHPHTIIISGYGDDKFRDIRRKIIDKRIRINREIEYLENQIDSIDDSEMRNILRLYYVKGYKQKEIADKLGYSTETIKKKFQRFWKNQK